MVAAASFPGWLRTENLDAPRGCVVISTPMSSSRQGTPHWIAFATCQGSTGIRTPVVRAQQAMRPRWTPRDENQSRLSLSVDRTGTTPLAERLLTALPGMPLPEHVGAFAPKNAAQPSCSRKIVAHFYLPDAPPLRRLNHAGDEPAHRMLNPAPVEVPSFVMHFIPSLTSLETVKSQAIDQRLPLPRGRTLSSRQGARFRPTSLEARVTDRSMLFAVRPRLR